MAVPLPLRDDLPAKRTPWVNRALLTLNIVVFLFIQPPDFQGGSVDGEIAGFGPEAEEFLYEYGTVPCEIQSGVELADEPLACSEDVPAGTTLPDGKLIWFSLVSTMFVHGSALHLAGNMFYLWLFGDNVEDRLGHVPYLMVYLATGLVADVAHVVTNLGSTVPTIGASGAVAGVMGAYAVLHPRARVLTGVLLPAMVAYLPAGFLIASMFMLEFFTPADSAVAWVAHVGGMVAGALIALVVRLVVKAPRSDTSSPG